VVHPFEYQGPSVIRSCRAALALGHRRCGYFTYLFYLDCESAGLSIVERVVTYTVVLATW
jgi:hypothetical protein